MFTEIFTWYSLASKLASSSCSSFSLSVLPSREIFHLVLLISCYSLASSPIR
nr:MAG TPA: hypothetical protein [Caudoviricetes sp.]